MIANQKGYAMFDWGYALLFAFVGACIGWASCSLWAVRVIDQARRHMRETLDAHLDMHTQDIQREYERLRLQEQFNRERA